jgi:uncharacterized protein
VFLPDVNVLIYAHRAEAVEHQRYKSWLATLVSSPAPFALSDLVSVGFVRIVTNSRIWSVPTPPQLALEFIERLRGRRNCRPVQAGAEGWKIFSDLVTRTNAVGKLVADAHHAAIAIEHGCELVTADGDFARFPGLRYRHPLQAP